MTATTVEHQVDRASQRASDMAQRSSATVQELNDSQSSAPRRTASRVFNGHDLDAMEDSLAEVMENPDPTHPQYAALQEYEALLKQYQQSLKQVQVSTLTYGGAPFRAQEISRHIIVLQVDIKSQAAYRILQGVMRASNAEKRGSAAYGKDIVIPGVIRAYQALQRTQLLTRSGNPYAEELLIAREADIARISADLKRAVHATQQKIAHADMEIASTSQASHLTYKASFASLYGNHLLNICKQLDDLEVLAREAQALTVMTIADVDNMLRSHRTAIRKLFRACDAEERKRKEFGMEQYQIKDIYVVGSPTHSLLQKLTPPLPQIMQLEQRAELSLWRQHLSSNELAALEAFAHGAEPDSEQEHSHLIDESE